MTTRRILCPDPSAYGGGKKPPVPPVTCCGEGEPYPNWLRLLLERLAGGKANLDFYIRIAERRVTDDEIARLLGVSRITARRYRLQWFSEMRRGWLDYLSEVAIREFLTDGRVAAVAPFTFDLKELPPVVTAVGGCERQFTGIPSCGELTAFCEQVYPILFGRHGAVLTLRRAEAGTTTTAAVVLHNGIGNSVARVLDDDRFGVAA